MANYSALLAPRRFSSRGGVWWNRITPLDLAAFILIVLICLVFGLRHIPRAPDDLSYLDYFGMQRSISFDNWWEYFIDEPLWNEICIIFSWFFSAETGFRIILLFSPALLFYGAFRLIGHTSLLFILMFIIDPNIGLWLYYAAIRQGFATSVFLTLFSLGIPALVAGLSGAAIHTALLFFAIVLVECKAVLTKNIRLVGVTLGTLLIGLYIIHNVGTIDFGRRASTFSQASELNIRYFLWHVPVYIAVLAFSYPKFSYPNKVPRQDADWHIFVVVATLAFFVGAAIFQSIPRLVATLDILIAIHVCRGIKFPRYKLAALVFLFCMVVDGPIQSMVQASTRDSWIAQWIFVLT